MSIETFEGCIPKLRCIRIKSERGGSEIKIRRREHDTITSNTNSTGNIQDKKEQMPNTLNKCSHLTVELSFKDT